MRLLLPDVSDYHHTPLRSQKVMDIFDGSYRVFINFYSQGQQVTLGYPKPNCSDTRIWLAVDGEEVGRISASEAKNYLESGMGYTLKSILPDLFSLNTSYATKPALSISSTSNYKPKAYTHATSGHCIRCGDDIDHDTDKPFCYSCYKSWAKWSNDDYEENYCHSCGKSYTTSKAKPLCKKCYYK